MNRTSIGIGGTLPAPDWWPTHQPRAPKPHYAKRRGNWFEIRNHKVTWITPGGTMTARKGPRTRP